MEKVYQAKSAHDAYKIANANTDKAPQDWEQKKVSVMEDIVRNKLEQNLYIKHKLTQTEERIIVEDSPKDSFWGWGEKRDGKNALGKIWMKLREELKNKE